MEFFKQWLKCVQRVFSMKSPREKNQMKIYASNTETLINIKKCKCENLNPLNNRLHWLLIKWVLLNRAPSSTQLHPPPLSSFQLPPSSLQHPQQYSNQNIARNWVISPNLGRRIQICPFWLKIGPHGILEVVIPNPDLDFWNSNRKIHFWANLGSKRQSCLFCLRLAHMVSQGCWFLFQHLLELRGRNFRPSGYYFFM